MTVPAGRRACRLAARPTPPPAPALPIPARVDRETRSHRGRPCARSRPSPPVVGASGKRRRAAGRRRDEETRRVAALPIFHRVPQIPHLRRRQVHRRTVEVALVLEIEQNVLLAAEEEGDALQRSPIRRHGHAAGHRFTRERQIDDQPALAGGLDEHEEACERTGGGRRVAANAARAPRKGVLGRHRAGACSRDRRPTSWETRGCRRSRVVPDEIEIRLETVDRSASK